MEFKELFPIWNQLTKEEQERLEQGVTRRICKKGTILHNGESDCIGLLLVEEGCLRAFTISEEGKEITLYRLFERDLCLFSAACMMVNIDFDMTIEADTDAVVWVIPVRIYKGLMEHSLAMSNFTNQVMATNFSDVMWLLDQILYKSFDARLAAFLVETSEMQNSLELSMTHDQIARNLGTAREVVTRMLKYFQRENAVELSRGVIRIKDKDKLFQWAKGSLR
ncbi:MAG: Crp/Fnr family transcriptional regulator [Firmicutes bacterium]|uniref:Crp/Fnr family transcriptional regulator n=1 Tax=Candidatus Scybalomonas excrementavium TaxID=2840943 RepID=A0A9D9HZ86_9FIRM|nr:Crp/Fnr family transcriptional regulator [Candidatus Scybalomonas excrementavium]